MHEDKSQIRSKYEEMYHVIPRVFFELKIKQLPSRQLTNAHGLASARALHKSARTWLQILRSGRQIGLACFYAL